MSLIETILNELTTYTGKLHQLKSHQALGGGCINQTQKLETSQGDYFIKFNRANMLDMFEAEAEGLNELAMAKSVRIPEVFFSGETDGHAYLVMEYIQPGSQASLAEFGEQMAQLHRYTKSQYGWHRDNTIGSTPQINSWCNNWVDFYRTQRLGYQINLALDNGIGKKRAEKVYALMESLEHFFTQPPEASVLHGDLWSGNYTISNKGNIVIYDPAVYFGDREADIAMTELFGGFSSEFYSGYQSVWPLDKDYPVRKTLYNLYHIINHYNLFGGGYASQAEQMTDQLLSEIR
jgi:fructosamine-3-kinase